MLLLTLPVKAQDTLWSTFNAENSGLPSNNIADIAFDSKGNTWIATWGGLVCLRDDNWKTYDATNSGLPVDLINHVTFDATGKLWIGTNGGGVVSFDGTNWKQFPLPGPGIALTVEVDAQGRKWIGTFTDGLYVLDGDKLTKVWGETGSLDNNVNDILFDNAGNTWFGTSQGAFMIKAGSMQPEKSPSFEGHVFDLDKDNTGRIWLATLPVGKLAWYEKGKWQEMSYITTAETDRMVSYHLQSVNTFPSGAVLTGTPTRGELARYYEGTWTRIVTPFAAQMSEGISSVEIDKNNNIWVGTWGQGLMVSDFFIEGEDSAIYETIAETRTFENREIEEQFTITVSNRSVQVRLWDEVKEDGDIVSLSLNGKWLVEDMLLERAGTTMTVELLPIGDNFLILHAENLGSTPPNTAAMEIIDGDRKTKLSLKSDLSRSGTIRIVYQPR